MCVCIRSRGLLFFFLVSQRATISIVKSIIFQSTITQIVKSFFSFLSFFLPFSLSLARARIVIYPDDAELHAAQSVMCSLRFEIVLIIDRLPCFVIIMNGTLYFPPRRRDVFSEDTFFSFSLSVALRKSRIDRAPNRFRGWRTENPGREKEESNRGKRKTNIYYYVFVSAFLLGVCLLSEIIIELSSN